MHLLPIPSCFCSGPEPPVISAEEAGGHDYNDEAEEEEGLGLRQSSGISQLPDFGGEDAEGNRSRKRRPIKGGGGGSGRAAAKGNRRRRLDEEDEQAEEQRVNRKRKRGESLLCWHHDIIDTCLASL